MTTTNIRWDITLRLVELLRETPALAGVQVEPGWPGDQLAAESIWVGNLDGELSVPVMNAGRAFRDDRWSIPLQIGVSNRDNLDDTATRLSQLIDAVDGVIADDQTLGDVDGLISADAGAVRSTVARTPQGHLGVAEFVVSCHARLA